MILDHLGGVAASRPRVCALVAGLVLSLCASIVEASPDTRLVDAVAAQDWTMARQLLKSNTNVDGARGDGTTGLIWAAHWDNKEIVSLLLRAKANVNATDDHGVTALSRACENASAAVVADLLKGGANPNVAQANGQTPLMIASDTGSLEAVKALLAHGADVNATTPTTGATALMWAVASGHRDIVQALVAADANVHVSSKKGFTPLLFAARTGDIDAAKILLAAGARVNHPGSEGVQALPLAIVDGRDQFALFLLEQGADANGTIDGVTPLHAAAGDVGTWLSNWQRQHGMSRRGERGLTRAGRLSLVKALLAHGANPNARITTSAVVFSYLGTPRRGAFTKQAVGTGDVGGATPLWVAGFSLNGGGSFGDDYKDRIESSAEIVKTLLSAGADHRISSYDGTTALMAAAGLGVRSFQPTKKRGEPNPEAEQAVKVLVEAGADVNATNEGDFTALHAATFRGWNEVVQYLVERGANINARDYRGRTAFRMAEGAKQAFELQEWPETAELLRTLGADTKVGIPGVVQERADRDIADAQQQ